MNGYLCKIFETPSKRKQLKSLKNSDKVKLKFQCIVQIQVNQFK